MALPSDVTTFSLTFGHSTNGYTDSTGAIALVGAKVKLWPVDLVTGKRLVVTHVATGQVIVPVDVTVTIDVTGKATVGPLPHTDNPTLSPVGFGYDSEWQVTSGSRRVAPRNKTFAVPAAAGATVDFDLLDVAAAVPGVLVPMGVSAGVADAAVSALLPGPSLTQAAMDGRYVRDTELDAQTAALVPGTGPTAVALRAAFGASDVPLVGYGDSTTAATSNVDPATRWPTLLATSLGVAVVNKGSSGTRSDEVAHRQGGLTAVATLTGNAIPTSGPVVISSIAPDALRGGEVTNYPATIQGVAGTISTNGAARSFTRAAAGAAVTVPSKVDVFSTEGDAYRANIQLIAVGINDIDLIVAGTRTVADVCTSISRMVTWLTPGNRRFLVWSPLDRGASEGAATAVGGYLRQIESFCAQQFGSRFFNLREYLSTRGLIDAGLTASSQDTTDMTAGAVPQSLRNPSSVHLNATGMQVQSAVFDRILRRTGWFPAPGPGPAPIAWSPGIYGSDLRAWYDPRIGTDGATVTALADKSASGNDLTAVTGAPVFAATGLAGTPCVSFNGASALKSTAVVVLSTPLTVLLNGKANTTGVTQYFADAAATNNLSVFRSAASGFGARRSGAAAALSQGTGDANPHSFAVVFNGATSKLFVDGIQVATGDQGAVSVATPLTLGAAGGLASFLTGQIGDFVLIGRPLSDAEVATATAWLTARRTP